MTDERMRARLREILKSPHYSENYEEPDIACKRCGRVIYCGDLSKICGTDCYKLQEQNAQSNHK